MRLTVSPIVLLAAALLVPCAAGQGGGGAHAERERAERQAEALAASLLVWGRAFNSGHLSLHHKARLVPGNEIYGPAVSADGPLRPREKETTHSSALQQLLYHAEQLASVPVARAVLPLASAGFERGLYEVEVVQVRDLAHWTLMRMEPNAIWLFLQRVAAGEAVAWLQRDSEPEVFDAASQVAALRLLGARNLGVFRPTVEQRLLAGDARVRLAAAEALEQMARPQSLSMVQRAVAGERHPVVVQALVNAIGRILRVGDVADPGERERAAEVVLRVLGRAGWRTDMTIVSLLEQHPIKATVPELIRVLARDAETDKLANAVNANATPLLKHRAWEALCAMTGTILPADQPAAWREFWERERDRIVLVDPSRRQKPAARTRATFYDIPVVGGEIAFIIDTSGSMKEPAGRETVGESERERRRRLLRSRLDAAKEQIVAAVQSMDEEARFHLLTFDYEAKVWNRKPVPPSAVRSLTETLGRFRAEGGTNVHAALAEILGAGRLTFGEQSASTIEEVFLLSDGEPTVGLEDPEEILRAVRELNRYQNLRINTVFAGVGKGSDFLRRLAEENGGVFVQR
jgi:hypothetical protein